MVKYPRARLISLAGEWHHSNGCVSSATHSVLISPHQQPLCSFIREHKTTAPCFNYMLWWSFSEMVLLLSKMLSHLADEYNKSWLKITCYSNIQWNHSVMRSASQDNWCTGTLLNRMITAQWEGMGDVGSAMYEPALLPPCLTIRVLSYSNCQRSTLSISNSEFSYNSDLFWNRKW